MSNVWTDFWIELAQAPVALGHHAAVVTLSAFLLSLRVRNASRTLRSQRRALAELQDAEQQLQSVRKDRSVLFSENRILREFVAQTDTQRALEALLRHFVPDANSGVAAFLQWRESELVVEKCRGLSDQSQNSLRIDPELLDRVADERGVVLADAPLFRSQIIASLAPADRRKVQKLFLIACGANEDLDGVLVTTSLCPRGAAEQQQRELAQRLMTSVAGSLRRSDALHAQQNQLRSKRDMLELRSIIDGHFETPLQMIETFLCRLAGFLGADRAAMFVSRRTAGRAGQAVVRCGNHLQAGVESRWMQYEDELAGLLTCGGEAAVFQREDLDQLGIDTLLGAAIVVPLVQHGESKGNVCFTKLASEPFSEAQHALAEWGVGFLAERIGQVLSHAKVERQAQQDSLTELANRRTFDRQINEALPTALSTGTECTLLLLDLDCFKAINDRYGHQAGDEVLRETARRIRDAVSRIRATDQAVVARYGGEELAVLLPGFSLPGATRIGDSIRAAIEAEPVRCGRQEIQVTTSIGIAACPQHARTVDGLIAAADAALYQAKEAGRNRVCVVREVLA